jgi:AIR synthase-related protein
MDPTAAMTAAELAAALRQTRGFAHKRDIADVVSTLGAALPGGHADLAQAVAVGDDCAAIADPGGDGYLLFAIEGFVEDFVQRMPWFAGYCGVMVNLSDVAAMGGRPIAVVDALWSRGIDKAAPILAGMAEASARYRVPIVGGHSNNRSERAQLAVAVLGRARRLLTSFNARPGDRLLMAVDLRGAYEEPFAYWNASTTAPAARLRDDLDLLPQLAEAGLADAAKDISMAGAIGTALMLLESSRVGAVIDVAAVPRPSASSAPPTAAADEPAALLRWLSAFPSYGFILSVRPEHAAAVIARFEARELACTAIGDVTAAPQLWLRRGYDCALLWDTSVETFIGCPGPQTGGRPDEPAGAPAAPSWHGALHHG